MFFFIKKKTKKSKIKHEISESNISLLNGNKIIESKLENRFGIKINSLRIDLKI